jgi:hypothetical protein
LVIRKICFGREINSYYSGYFQYRRLCPADADASDAWGPVSSPWPPECICGRGSAGGGDHFYRIGPPLAFTHDMESRNNLTHMVERNGCRCGGTGYGHLNHPNTSPRIRFLFIRPAFCFRLPPDAQSSETPLLSANSSPCRVSRGLSPPSRAWLGSSTLKQLAAHGPHSVGRHYCRHFFDGDAVTLSEKTSGRMRTDTQQSAENDPSCRATGRHHAGLFF